MTKIIRNWRVVASVILSGLCLGISQPLVIAALSPEPLVPHGLLGLLSLIGYAPVIYWLRVASPGRAFVLSFFASLVHFSITFYWIAILMTVFGGVSIALSAALLLIMSAVVALYIASAFAVAQYLHLRFGFAHYFILPVAVCAVEYLRNYGFVGGFPWGNVGYGISQVSVFLQSASLVGVYGLVFVVVMVNTLIAHFTPKRALMASAIIALMVGFGLYRLQDGFDTHGKMVRVALLQGNIEQGIKNKAALYSNEILARYKRLQDEAVSRGAELVIWPESGFPLSVPESAPRMRALGEAAPVTVIGAVVYGENAFHNSAVVLDHDFRITGRYHKSHLVPFGEYVPWPLRSVANRVVPGLGAFYPGNEYRPLAVKINDSTAVELGLTICYEGVFPEISRTQAQNGADLLVNLTNDAWYGVSSAPYQHLHMYRLRSVETGLPFVRATNTGVSAWIDALGFVHDPTALYEQAIVMADVPLVKKPTLYMVIGDFVAQLSLVFVLLALILGLVGRDVFLRRRALVEWVMGASGLALILWSHWHFADARAALDESALTKETFLSAYGFVLLTSAWSGRNSGRRALIIVSCVLMVLAFLVGLAEGYQNWLTAGFAALVAVIAYKRVRAYK